MPRNNARELRWWELAIVAIAFMVLTIQPKCQELPDAPTVQVDSIAHRVHVNRFAPVVTVRWRWWRDAGFVVSEGGMWGSIIADGAASMRWVGDRRCGYVEGNPLYAEEGGHRFNSGRYWSINVAIGGLATAVHIVQRKGFNSSKVVNRVTDIVDGLVGMPHARAAGAWMRDCW